jgi:hypothetical protein
MGGFWLGHLAIRWTNNLVPLKLKNGDSAIRNRYAESASRIRFSDL